MLKARGIEVGTVTVENRGQRGAYRASGGTLPSNAVPIPGDSGKGLGVFPGREWGNQPIVRDESVL